MSANVVDNCIIGATALNLGTFDGTNDLASSSNITVRCSNGTDYTVDLSTGSSGSYVELRRPADPRSRRGVAKDGLAAQHREPDGCAPPQNG